MNDYEKWLGEVMEECHKYNEYSEESLLEAIIEKYRSYTCKMEKIPHISGRRCESCGFHTSEISPSYCPNCGRKAE